MRFVWGISNIGENVLSAISLTGTLHGCISYCKLTEDLFATLI